MTSAVITIAPLRMRPTIFLVLGFMEIFSLVKEGEP
jgi:hypothetical protein